MHHSVSQMWRAFLELRGDTPESTHHRLSFWHFCDTEEDADLCAQLVLQGVKRATAPSLWYFLSRNEPLPVAGDLHVVTNWAGEAQCVIRATSVEIVPFGAVTEDHAAAEGEGDRSLAWWRRVHWEYYQRELADTGFTASEDMPVVCEQFERVYPVA